MSKRREAPDLLVEQLALGELDEERAAALRAELEREAAGGGRDRLAEIADSNREILSDYPPERVAADIRRRAAREPDRRQRRSILWVLGPALAAACALVWVVVRDDGAPTLARVEATSGAELVDDGRSEPTRIKGGVEPHIVIDRKTESGHARLGPDEHVRAGDVLQVSYVAAGRGEGVIVSIDGAGIVTLHHPSDPDAPPKLTEGKEVPLAAAYELDDAPGFERFVFVTRDDGPLATADVLAAAERLANDPLAAKTEPLELEGAGWMQHSMLLPKAPAADDQPAPTPAEGDP